jgi:hypothetical protein
LTHVSNTPRSTTTSEPQSSRRELAEDDWLDGTEVAQPRKLSGFDHGLLAALVSALAYGVLVYPIGLTWGLVAAGVAGGWLIGRAVSHGAWKHASPRRERSVTYIAVFLAIAVWPVGMFISYLISQLLIEGATQPLLERVTAEGFGNYLTGIYGVYHLLSVVGLAIMAWRTTRPAVQR